MSTGGLEGRICVLCLVMVLLSTHGVVAGEGVALLDPVVQSSNGFALDLYRLFDQESNVFFSPYSISTALAMTYAGARGRTEEQMTQVLRFTLSQEQLHPVLAELRHSLEAPNDKYTLSIANSLWGQTEFPFSDKFVDLNLRYYGGKFYEVDYVDPFNREAARLRINRWVAENTNEKITNLLSEKDLSALTRLVLTNAIYFKGTWKLQFDPQNTRDMPFYSGNEVSTEVPMMYQKGIFNYTETDTAQVIELPYNGENVSMLIFLPHEDRLRNTLEASLDLEYLQTVRRQLIPTTVEVYLPRFRMREKTLLNQHLQELGMVDAFDQAVADFSGMIRSGSGLYISKVIHEAFVEVNEEGTEAAAATAVIVSGKSVGLDLSPVFLADHPFIFLIQDNETGVILFVGRLIDPMSQ